MAPVRNVLSGIPGWRLAPSHGSESACGRGVCMLGWGGSAGVVNQAAEMSETASSQHQGSSAPLPSQVCFITTAMEAILHTALKISLQHACCVQCSSVGNLSNEYVRNIRILITDYLIPKKAKKKNFSAGCIMHIFMFLLLSYNKYLENFNRLVLFLCLRILDNSFKFCAWLNDGWYKLSTFHKISIQKCIVLRVQLSTVACFSLQQYTL